MMKTPIPFEAVDRAPSPRRPAFRSGWFTTLIRRCSDWHDRLQQRRHLGQLSPHMLRDIGLTGVDVDAELRKLPWQG